MLHYNLWRVSSIVYHGHSKPAVGGLDFGPIFNHNYSRLWIVRDTPVQTGRGNTQATNNPASNRGIRCLKGAKRSPLTKWKCWKSWAKETKAVIGRPSECQKQRDFQGGLDFDEKRGGGRGGQKCKILGKYAVQSGQTRSVSSAFWSESCEFGAFEFILIESVLESGPKRPHWHNQPQGSGPCRIGHPFLQHPFTELPLRTVTAHGHAASAATYANANHPVLDRRRRREVRRPRARQAHPRPQRGRQADRPRPGHRLHARRPLSRTDPPAQGGRARLLARRHLQPRRILPDARRRIRTRTSAGCTRRFFNHVNMPVGEHPHPRRHARRRTRSTTSAPSTSRRSRRPAASTCRSWASAAPGTSASTNRAARGTAARAWSRSTASPAATRPAASSARRTCRTRRSRWASRSILDARRIVLMAFGEHKAAIVVQGGRAAADRSDLGELPPGAPGRDGRSRRSRGRGADGDQAAVGGRARATGRRS